MPKPKMSKSLAQHHIMMVVDYQKQIKNLYELIDQHLAKLAADGTLPGTFYREKPTGDVYEYVDQFAEKSVVFRPAGVRRFDVVPMTKKRAEELSNAAPRKRR